ncbi:TetR family transcriptional regulator [Streptomyces sp. WM6373]|nr:TetR family transcriptional regulator [Streptomyces sp. WM6373]KOU64102.1 TetR family transcriptional regulator [Streptomyces sp. IGB124]KOU75790.1 TetR family transcriptional regulator [Streptomyces sp. XY66]KOU92345.1 TetR family transcriptional regulator [Streptomyces sp. XY58]KOV07236.1 TetR family transcriptional regulator [Streptomyces sp. XY37]KOV18556.1 TetR family transcriptional regulator [Streptomyces sp. XY413]KOV33028.1 TetR family transcriptional regulator [Streptomyces sp. H
MRRWPVVARPRGIEDAVILQATARVMGRVGPTGLTLAAVAREVGLVPGTLVQRFGSKRGLLLALADRSAKEAGEAAGRVRDAGTTALDALAALTSQNLAGMDTPESFAHHLAFLCTDLTDPQLYERALAVHRAQRRAIEALLAEAADAGELRAGTDVAALAGTVQAITAGAGLSWAVERRGGLAQRLRRELDAVLLPHLPPRRHPRETEES